MTLFSFLLFWGASVVTAGGGEWLAPLKQTDEALEELIAPASSDSSSFDDFVRRFRRMRFDDVEATDAVRRRKGRYAGKSGQFDDVEATDAGSVQRSLGGYVLLVTNVHAEAKEDDIFNKFSDVGEVSDLYLNLDRRTGLVKGYALVEYKTLAEAKEAVKTLNGETIREQHVGVSWAFKKPNRRRRLADDEFYLRYYVGSRGNFGHEFLEFEIRNNGLLRFALNSNDENAQLIRKEVNVTPEIVEEFKQIISDSTILQEDDNNWPQPNEVGRQEIEIVMGNEHISFVTTKIASTADIDKSDDPEGLRNFYYAVQDLKAFVFSLLDLHFKIKPIAMDQQLWDLLKRGR